MRLDEIDRRGFLRAASVAGASAAAASIAPAQVLSVINTYTKALGGKEMVTLLDQLLRVADPKGLLKIGGAFGDPGNLDEFHTALFPNEKLDLKNSVGKLFSKYHPGTKSGPGYEDYEEFYYELIFGIKDGNDDGRGLDQVLDVITKLIGRKTKFSMVNDILKKNGISGDEFARDGKLWTDIEEIIYNIKRESKKEIQKSSDHNIEPEGKVTIDNIVDMAKEASLPAQTIRFAGIISSLVKKLLGKDNQSSPPTALPTPPKEKPLALPAPSDKDEIEGMNDIERMKNLAGIQRKQDGIDI